MHQDWQHVVTVSHFMGQLLEAASSKFLELGSLGRGQRAVDIACGVGSLAAQAATIVAGQGGGVVGIDACPEMIAAANAMYGTAGGALQFAVHDAHQGVGHPNSYDAAFCRFSLPFLADPARVLAACHEALKPGGRMCVMSIADAEHNDFMRALAGPPIVDHVLQAGHQDRIASQLQDAGFQNVLTKRIRALVTIGDPNEYWQCVRGLYNFAEPTIPAVIADRVRPGARLTVSIVFAIGRKHDPNAAVQHEVQSAADAVALARRKTREINPKSIQAFKGEQVVFLDIRSPSARLTKIRDSINVTRDDLEKQLPAMVPDPATNIVVYCQNGNQSVLAAGQLRAMGYTNVWSLQRGIEAWEYVGMKTVPA